MRIRPVQARFEFLENRLLFAFGEADANFGIAGRALVGLGSSQRIAAVQQMTVTSAGKILAGGTTGLTRFTAGGVVDSGFGNGGKISLAAAANFVSQAVAPSNNSIYVLVSASTGTGLLRYTANGKVDTTYGGGSGSVTVTTAKTFQPQALTVQSDGKVIVAGVFKTDANNAGRKVRVYRIKTDGKSDTTFGDGGSKEFNLGTDSFLYPIVYDKVVGVKVVAGGKIVVSGGSIDYAPASSDGQFTPVSHNHAQFVAARLTSGGQIDSGFADNGFARAEYAGEEQINVNGIDLVLPSKGAFRSDDSVLLAGLATGASVGEFSAAGALKYVTSAGNPRANQPVGLTALPDGRAALVTRSRDFSGEGFSMTAISANGEMGNIVYTSDDEPNTTDISENSEGAASVAADGNLLVGGGDALSSFIVQKFDTGNANDPRPDEFANARANDIVKDSKGGLHVAYYNAATTHLMYAHRNPNGIWDAPVVVDPGNNAGQYVSIDVTSKDKPGIGYFDGNGGDLKYASFDGKKWTFETVDFKGSVGLYPSFTYDNADEPVMTYFNKTRGKLTFALKRAGVWGFENVDSSGHIVGRSSVLVASPKTQRYTVAYMDGTTNSVMWAGHQKGGKWTVKVAAKTKGGADFLSMAYGYYYEPTIAYYDAFAADLKITSYYNGLFNVKTLATSQAQGLYTAAYFADYFGNGQVLAYHRSQDKITLFKNVLDTVPTNTDIVTGGGRFLSVDWDGRTTDLAYFDAPSGAIRVRPGPALG